MKRVEKFQRWFCIALLSLAILALGLVLKAQAASTSELRFQRLSALGADQLSTLSLLQDRQGFIWIGTNNAGLYRFDGYHSEKYQSQANDPHSLPHDRISALYEDQQGRIWAGTQNGLALFNPKTNNFTRYIIEGGPSNQRIIKVIASDGKDGLWLATWGGLQHFDTNTGKFTLYAHDPNRPDSLGKNDLNAIVVDLVASALPPNLRLRQRRASAGRWIVVAEPGHERARRARHRKRSEVDDQICVGSGSDREANIRKKPMAAAEHVR